jgi:glutaconate CoA-transferase subunit A
MIDFHPRKDLVASVAMMASFPDSAGALFADPSSNRARAYFRGKSHALADKVMTVSDAVTRLVRDGDYLALGGFGGARIPTAVCHEIVRQKKQNLRFAGFTATHTFQVLAAGNLTGRGKLLAQIDNAYSVGLEARGLSPHGRRVMESGEVEVVEWSNYTMALRFKAAAMGVPFLPCRSLAGTDTFRRSAAKMIACPFTGETLTAIPALYPDSVAIHVHEADCYGNCRLRGTSVADLDLARAAKRLIITCERLISTEVIRQEPTLTAIPFYCVDAVCEVPYGSYPGNMPYQYYSDEDHLKRWLEVERDPERYQNFLDNFLFGVRDFHEYLERCGGLRRMQKLREQEFMLHTGGSVSV